MKYSLLFISLVTLVTLSSCKKDHTCSCTYQTTTGQVSQTTTIKDTKKEAEKICDTYETPVAGYFWKCEILD